MAEPFKITKRGAWLHARPIPPERGIYAALNLITGEFWGCTWASDALCERAKAYPEQEPRTREEMNAARIKTPAKATHADKITLIRVRSLSQLKKDGEECEYNLYERDEDGRLNGVFFQVNYEALRVYIDHKPDEQPHDEKHDDEETEYYDIDGDECAVFDDCALFIRETEQV